MNSDLLWQQYLTVAIRSACVRLFESQPDLHRLTSETDQREPNLSFHFASTLWPYLPWLNCDFDVLKPHLGSKRPDIIFHRRSTHRFNFLVVEVKRHPDDIAEDLAKITGTWFDGRLNYRFGAAVFLSPETRSAGFRLVSRESGVCTSESDFERVPQPHPSWSHARLAEVDQKCREIIETHDEQEASIGVGDLEQALLSNLLRL